MERNNGKWNFDETKRSDTRASIERYIFDSFDSSKNTGLMKLGNFPFTLLENLRENSPGEQRRFNIAIAQLAHRRSALSLMQFARVIIKQTPLSVIMRLKHRRRETPFTTDARIDPRFRDIRAKISTIRSLFLTHPTPKNDYLDLKICQRFQSRQTRQQFQRISTKVLTVLLNRIII